MLQALVAVARPAMVGSQQFDRSGPVKQRWKSAVRSVAIVTVALGAAIAIYAERSTIDKGLHNVRNLSWAWVAAASIVEVLSMVALALLYRELLRANGARLGVIPILAASYTANAISVAVPVIGSGIASRQAYRQFREGGADPAAASLSLTVAGIVCAVTLATVVTASAVLSGNPAAATSGLVIALVMAIAAGVVALELGTQRGRPRLLRLVTFFLRFSQRVVHRPRRHPEAVAEAVMAAVQRMRLDGPALARLLLWGLLNWWTDVACLAFAMRATGIDHLSVGQILLVWTAGAAATSLSPTPAGIGVVEIAMVASLAAVGVRGPSAITTILVYRIITLKGAVSVWALLYGYIQRRRSLLPHRQSNRS